MRRRRSVFGSKEGPSPDTKEAASKPRKTSQNNQRATWEVQENHAVIGSCGSDGHDGPNDAAVETIPS